MSPSADDHEVYCAFCGQPKKFLRNDLYERRSDGTELFKEKFCKVCGEPLIGQCPNCQTRFPIKDNLSHHAPLKTNPFFWDPTPSQLDSQIPLLEEKFKLYADQALELTVAKFRSSQHEFLISLPGMITVLDDFLHFLDALQSHASLEQSLKKEFRRLRDEITDILKDANKIRAAIIIHEEETIKGEKMQSVNDKLEAKLKNKGFNFLQWENKYLAYLNNVKTIRADEIASEKATLKPGFDKIQKYILYDPSFYQLTCPRCEFQIYSIKNNLFVVGEPDKNYNNAHNLGNLVSAAREAEDDSKTLHLNVIITLQKSNQYLLNGKLTLLLENGQETVIGREIIRDIDFQGDNAEELLFDESDPLAMVSRTQFTLMNTGKNILVKGQPYDELRIGTYLNSLDTDIRLSEQNTLRFNKGDKIIIPLTKEQDNSNLIEIEYK